MPQRGIVAKSVRQRVLALLLYYFQVRFLALRVHSLFVCGSLLLTPTVAKEPLGGKGKTICFKNLANTLISGNMPSGCERVPRGDRSSSGLAQWLWQKKAIAKTPMRASCCLARENTTHCAAPAARYLDETGGTRRMRRARARRRCGPDVVKRYHACNALQDAHDGSYAYHDDCY